MNNSRLNLVLLAFACYLASWTALASAHHAPPHLLPSQIEKLKIEAEKGDGEASYELYYHYARQSQRDEAMRWLRLSAERKFSKAYYGLAVELYFVEGKAKEAKPWAVKAVQAREEYAKGVLDAIEADIASNAGSPK